jgi:hypothetical protein
MENRVQHTELERLRSLQFLVESPCSTTQHFLKTIRNNDGREEKRQPNITGTTEHDSTGLGKAKRFCSKNIRPEQPNDLFHPNCTPTIQFRTDARNVDHGLTPRVEYGMARSNPESHSQHPPRYDTISEIPSPAYSPLSYENAASPFYTPTDPYIKTEPLDTTSSYM